MNLGFRLLRFLDLSPVAKSGAGFTLTKESRLLYQCHFLCCFPADQQSLGSKKELLTKLFSEV